MKLDNEVSKLKTTFFLSFKIASWRFRRLVFCKAELLNSRFLMTLIKNLEPSSSVLSTLFQANTVLLTPEI